MTTFIINVISHTPPWVWLILVGVTVLGLRQAREYTVSRLRVLIQPAAMGSLSLWSTIGTFGWHLTVQPMWLVGLAMGLALNRALILPRSVQAQPDGRFTIGGSWLPLALMLSIFALRYVAAASLAIAPALQHEPAFAAAVSLLYGLPTGLLMGRAWRVLGHARRVSPLQMA